MNAEHGSGCGCEAPRRTVTDFFLNACRRATVDLATPHGEPQRAHDGAFVQFAVRVDGGAVVDARYRATTCAALVAYAELLAEQVVGLPAAEAMRIAPGALVERLPGVPAYKHERATLVVHALWSAVARTVEAGSGVEVRTTR